MVKVREIMKRHVVSIDPKITVSDAAKIMSNNNIGSVIITKQMKPIGIITSEDIVSLVAHGKDPKKTRIEKMKMRKLITLNPEDTMLSATKKMIKTNVKRMPVVKDGKLQGILSDKDILLIAPELIEVLSEKLKARVALVARPDRAISGICERCESYSDDLRNVGGRWFCEDCRD